MQAAMDPLVDHGVIKRNGPGFRLLRHTLQKHLADAAAQGRPSAAGLALPGHLRAIDGDAEAPFLPLRRVLPGDADIAVLVEVPAAAVARAAGLLVGGDAAGQEVDIEGFARG